MNIKKQYKSFLIESFIDLHILVTGLTRQPESSRIEELMPEVRQNQRLVKQMEEGVYTSHLQGEL